MLHLAMVNNLIGDNSLKKPMQKGSNLEKISQPQWKNLRKHILALSYPMTRCCFQCGAIRERATSSGCFTWAGRKAETTGAAGRRSSSERMQLHGTARHCRLLCQSLRALKSCATLAPSPPHSRQVMPEHV